MWRLANHKRRLFLLTIVAAAMLVVGVLPLRGDIAHSDTLDQDPTIYLPLVMKRYCTDAWQDDFSDPASGWPVSDDSYRKLEYLAGEFHVRMKTDWSAIYFSTWPFVYATSFTLEVDGRSGFGTYGLVFGADWYWVSEYYTFQLEPGNYWAIYKTDWPEIFEEVLDSGYSPYITSDMNHLRIVRDGSLIEAYVNGHLLSTVRDSSFLGSRIVGLTAGSLDTRPVDAYFDNFRVCPVDSAPGVGAAAAPGIREGIILRRGTPPTIEFWPR